MSLYGNRHSHLFPRGEFGICNKNFKFIYIFWILTLGIYKTIMMQIKNIVIYKDIWKRKKNLCICLKYICSLDEMLQGHKIMPQGKNF